MPKLVLVASEDWHFYSHRLHMGLAAKRNGFDVSVVTRCRLRAADLANLGLCPINFEMERRGLSVLGIWSESMRLRKILNKIKPDIIHFISLRSVVVGAVASTFIFRPKLVLALNGLGYLFTDGRDISLVSKILKALLPILLRRGLIVVQNTDDFDFVRKSGVHGSRIRLIRGAGVDVKLFRSSNEPSGTPIVMLPARLLRDKGVYEFVKAAQLLRAKGVKARFVLVGSPDQENPSTVSFATCRQWAAEGIVEAWGSRERMEEVLPQSTVVCLPSYREGLPKSLLEAMACRRPCITTDNSGCREAVRNNDNGLLVPSKDPYALAAAIERLLDDRQLRIRMGCRGRERAVNEFSNEVVDAQTLSIYEELLA